MKTNDFLNEITYKYYHNYMNAYNNNCLCDKNMICKTLKMLRFHTVQQLLF